MRAFFQFDEWSSAMKVLRLRIVLALAAHLVVAAIWPTSTAHANGVIGFRREHFPAMVIVPQVVMADGGFLVVDAVYGLRGRLLPPGWAIAQAIVGGLGSYVGSALLLPLDAGAAIGLAAVGTWFIGHSIWSLVQHGRDHPPSASSPARRSGPRGMPPAPRNDLMVVPIAHGAALVASGVF